MTSLKVTDVHKSFQTRARIVPVLRGISFDMTEGQDLAIMGPSGSGKSTLLHLIGTLDTPTSGSIEVNGQNPFALIEAEIAKFRNQVIGFVFQDHHLLPQYSVLENVLIPTMAFPKNKSESARRAHDLLERVGLANRLDHRPAELSGGESQRVAVARALINRPALLLCDEPTGNLDSESADTVAQLLFELHQEARNILIVVTHNQELANRFEKSFQLHQGVLR